MNKGTGASTPLSAYSPSGLIAAAELPAKAPLARIGSFNFLHIPSIREAMFTSRPMTVKSSR